MIPLASVEAVRKESPTLMYIFISLLGRDDRAPFISVYNLTERTERSFSKIKLFASDISLLTFVVFPIAEEVKV